MSDVASVLRLLANAAPDALAVAEKVLVSHAAQGGEVNQTIRHMAEQGLISKGGETLVNMGRGAQGKPMLTALVTLPRLCERLEASVDSLSLIIEQLNSVGFALTGEPFSDKVYRVMDELYPPQPEPATTPGAAEAAMPGSLSHFKYLVERFENQTRYLNAFQTLCGRLTQNEQLGTAPATPPYANGFRSG